MSLAQKKYTKWSGQNYKHMKSEQLVALSATAT